MADNDKPKRQRPEQQVQTEAGDNTKYVSFNLMLSKLGKVDMSDNTAVAQRCEQYFSLCAEYDMKPNMAALALSLGIERHTLLKYRTGALGKKPDVVSTLKKAATLLETMMNDYAQNGKINPVTSIFLLKNNFLDYTDKQEIVVTPKTPLGEQIAPDALADKYRDSIPADFDKN